MTNIAQQFFTESLFLKTYFFTTFASMYQHILCKLCYIIINTKTILPLKSLKTLINQSLNVMDQQIPLLNQAPSKKNTIIRHKKMQVGHDQRNRWTDVIELSPPSFPHIRPKFLRTKNYM